MKRIIASLVLCAFVIGASAQSYEPQFNSELRLLSVNEADTTVYTPESTYGTVKVKKKGGLFGKIAKGVSIAGSAASGLGLAGGSLDVAVAGMRAANAANAASDINEVVDMVAGKAFVSSSFVLRNPTSSCIVPIASESILIVRVADNSENPTKLIQILPLEKKKKERQYEFAEVKDDSATVLANALPFTGEKYGESSYLLRFNAPAGEYAVTLGEDNLLMHCFTIVE